MYQLLILSNNSLQIHYYWAPRDSDNILDIHNYHSKGCLDYSTHSFYYFCFALLPQNQVSLFIHCTPEEGINIIVRIKATKRMREHHLLCFIYFECYVSYIQFLTGADKHRVPCFCLVFHFFIPRRIKFAILLKFCTLH